jgi:formamidopyrimidine-DNA glycosylase
MGPEPLSRDFNFKIFVEQLKKRKGRIKSLLLNQSFLAGIGNIYGDEILFQSRIKPTRKTHNLTKDQIRNLYNKIRYVLKKACELNADLSSMRTWFLYGRGEGFCIKCKGSLDRVKIQGRYSYFCPRCQR